MTAPVSEPAVLAALPREAGAVPVRRAVVVRLEGRVLALAADPGCRVVEIQTCIRVPTGPDCLIGLGNGQGDILAVVDIRPLLGLPAAAWKWPLLAQIVGDPQMKVAFAIEEVLGLTDLDEDRLEPLGPDLPAGLEAFGKGAIQTPVGHAVLLAVPEVLETLRLGKAEQVAEREEWGDTHGEHLD